jgi:hypothetical protein
VDAGASTEVAGVSAIEASVAEFTVNGAEPSAVSKLALILDVPVFIAVAIPLLPAVSLMVATPLSAELQLTSFVMTCVLPSLNAPVAVNACCVPGAMEALDGVTEIETILVFVTVNVVEPVITVPPVRIIEAVIVVWPALSAVAVNPPFFGNDATPGLEEAQVT